MVKKFRVGLVYDSPSGCKEVIQKKTLSKAYLSMRDPALQTVAVTKCYRISWFK